MLFTVCCLCVCVCSFFFFFKQKTAYEMRISDWSSDVCSSDLLAAGTHRIEVETLPSSARPGAPAKLILSIDGKQADEATTPFTVPLTLKIGRASCRERVCQYV